MSQKLPWWLCSIKLEISMNKKHSSDHHFHEMFLEIWEFPARHGVYPPARWMDFVRENPIVRNGWWKSGYPHDETESPIYVPISMIQAELWGPPYTHQAWPPTIPGGVQFHVSLLRTPRGFGWFQHATVCLVVVKCYKFKGKAKKIKVESDQNTSTSDFFWGVVAVEYHWLISTLFGGQCSLCNLTWIRLDTIPLGVSVTAQTFMGYPRYVSITFQEFCWQT